MQALPHDGSLIASLHELREIEEQRLVDERLALRRTEEAARLAREAEAQRARDAEAERVRSEHAAALALEVARAATEREARLRLEAEDLAERTRHQLALDSQRVTGELELRRAEVARKRPTWMLATTVLAVLASAALGWFGIERDRDSTAAYEARDQANVLVAAARSDVKAAKAQLARLSEQVVTLDQKVATALKSIEDAKPRLADPPVTRKRPVVVPAGTPRPPVDDHIFKISDECLNNAICEHPTKTK